MNTPSFESHNAPRLFLHTTAFPLIAMLSFGLTSESAAAYDFETFGVSGAPITSGSGLSDGNCQVGSYQDDAADPSTAHAIVRCGGQIETIDPPTSVSDRRAFDINSAGVVVGSARRATGLDSFELNGTTYTWVEYPGADQTVLHGINDAGDVVGEYSNTGGLHRGFARIDGKLLAIDVPLARATRPRGINNAGDIVGFWEDSAGLRHAFIREPTGIFTTFDAPGATETLLGDLNDTGEIAGSYVDSDGTSHGLLITAPLVQFLTMDVPGSSETLARGINEAGELTGEWIDDLGIHRGFVARLFLFADGFESGNTDGWSTVQPRGTTQR